MKKNILIGIFSPLVNFLVCNILNYVILAGEYSEEYALFHNMLIDFKSDGEGFIHNLTLEELLEYNFSGEKITILKELLNKINSKKILLLEIKEEKNNINEIVINYSKSINTLGKNNF